MQLPEYMWVDDTSQMENSMKKAFPSLQKVLEDATHGMRRYARTFPDGHVGIKGFMANLSKAFFKVEPSDEKQLKAELMDAERWGVAGSKERAAAEKMLRSRCRHTIPPAEELHQRVEKVFAEHEGIVDPISGAILINDATRKVHESMLALIDAGKFSDPLSVDEMYLHLNGGKKDKFIGLRGTSKLEGFHCHLAKVLQGNRCSAELAGAMMADFTHNWNIDRAVTNKKGTIDYGCYDTMLLEKINGLCEVLKLPPQFSHLKATPKLEKIPPMFTLAVPPELEDVLCPPEGGIAPLNGAVVQDDDACVAIDEFENVVLPSRLCTNICTGANATAAPGVVAIPMGTQESPRLEMPETLSHPLSSLSMEQQQKQEKEMQSTVFQAAVLPQQQTLQPEEQRLDGIITSPVVADGTKSPRSPSKQGKRGRGRPRKSESPKEKNLPLAASPSSANTFSASHETVRRTKRAKRNEMPVDYSGPVETEEEAILMIETIGGDVASGQLRSPKKQSEIAERYNKSLQKKLLLEDQQAVAGMSFKQSKHVKQFVQATTENLAASVTNQQVLSNQQRGVLPAPIEGSGPVETPEQFNNLSSRVDASMLTSQQASMAGFQQLEAMQHHQQQCWPSQMQQPALPPQDAQGQYYHAPMHPLHPHQYSGFGMYPNLDPAALVQAAAALLQAQQPLATVGKGGKGAPGKPRNCSKCGKPLKGKDKEEGACFCRSKAMQEQE